LQRFKGEAASPAGPMAGLSFGEPPGDPFLPYRVNVFVDNSETQGPPIIVETNPTYHNLFGVIEKKPIMGGYTTDFTLIKAGSISKATAASGALIGRVYSGLEKRSAGIRIANCARASTFFGFVPPPGLRPNRSDTKVLHRRSVSYRALATVDPDFRKPSAKRLQL
jgi:hypothetical protein